MSKASYAPPAASPADLANETTARQAADALALQKASNLGDVANPATARTNLALGSAATQNTSAFDAAGAATAAQTASLQKSANLSDVSNAATARTNLGVDQTTLDARYVKVSALAPTFAVLGDSISANNGAAGTVTAPAVNALHIVFADGYWTWTNMRLLGRAPLSYNFGVGGETTTQILARVGSVLAANPKPGYCVVQGYSNDPANGVSTATTISNLIAICEALRVGGVTPILTSAVPKNTAPIPPGQINRALFAYVSKTPGVLYCDWYPYLADPTTGNWATGLSDDGTHPNAQGASQMGLALSAVLDPVLRISPALFGSNADTLNKVTNGLFVGNTAGKATSWTSRMGANATFTKVTRTDGIQGEWQQIVVASPGTSGNSGDIYGSYTSAVGDVLQASIEYQIDATPSAVTAFGLYVTDGSGANEQMIVNSKSDGSGLGTVSPSFPSRGVLMSPPFQTQVTSGFVLAKFACTTGTIRWARASLVKLA